MLCIHQEILAALICIVAKGGDDFNTFQMNSGHKRGKNSFNHIKQDQHGTVKREIVVLVI